MSDQDPQRIVPPRGPLDAPTVTQESGDDAPQLTPTAPIAPSPPPPLALTAGTLISCYEVVRPLGRGGMGHVYLARDTRLGRLVALKFLSAHASERAPQRFFAEARATAGLAQENIVTLYDIAAHAGTPYMVLEYLRGQTFKELLHARRPAPPGLDFVPLPPARAVELIVPVVRALVAAHEARIVHRDLKPSNLMLADNGVVKVLDFGIAKMAADADADADAPADGSAPAAATPVDNRRRPASAEPAEPLRGSPSVTLDGEAIGSRPYMSPEQWGSLPVDDRSDLWSLGIILYQMVSGRHPLADVPPGSLGPVVLDLDAPVPSLQARHPELGALGAIVDRCLVKRREGRVESAARLLAELEALARPGTGDAEAAPAEEEQPYAGLASFQERDAARFYGRAPAVAEVVTRLGQEWLVALVAPSGAGKSSFVRAGVIPALKRSGDRWDAFTLRPGPQPLAALAEVLLQLDGASDDAAALVARLRAEPGFFGTELRRHARAHGARILVFVDQAEELYTLAPADARAAFLGALAGAGGDGVAPVRVVLALRSDFLDRLTDAPPLLLEALSRNTVLLRPLDREGLRSALVKPAEACGYRFAAGTLVDTMIDALAHHAGALPLLQFTAARLWELRDRQRHLMTDASYHAIGGIGGALASHADAVLGAMRSDERAWARTIFLRLVTPERTRALVPRRELGQLGRDAAGEVDRVLGRLIDARLVTVGGSGSSDDTDSAVELVHEALIERWPLLAGWLDDEAHDAKFTARLRGAAADWEAAGRPEGLVWRGDSAREASRWYQRHRHRGRAALGPREERYLETVIALERAGRRRRRLVVGGAFVLLLAAVAIVSSQALYHRRAALHARDVTRVAAARLHTEDPTLQLAILRELDEPSPPPGWMAETKRALHAGVSQLVLPHDDPVRSIAFSSDGRTIATGTYRHKAVFLWNADGSGAPRVIADHDGQVGWVAYSPDGRWLASASGDTTVRVRRADGSGPAYVYRGHKKPVWAIAFSPDSRRIASASLDGTVQVWSADGAAGTTPLVLLGHEGGVSGVAFSPDGKRIASSGADRTIRIWAADGSSAAAPLVLRGHTNNLAQVAFSPDGKRLASVAEDGTLRLWDTDGPSDRPSPGRVLATEHGLLETVAFSPDGRRLAWAGEDGVVRIAPVDDTAHPMQLLGHTSTVFVIAFSPDGKRIASASFDGNARVFATEDERAPLVLRHPHDVIGADFSPDGRRIVTSSSDGVVRIWDAGGSGAPRELSGHQDTVLGVGFMPDGQRVLSESYDGTVRIWDAGGGAVPRVFGGFPGMLRGVAALAPDGKRLAILCGDLRIVDSEGPFAGTGTGTGATSDRGSGNGQPLILRPRLSAPGGIIASPDGRRVAIGLKDGTVQVFASDGAGAPIELHRSGMILGLAFAPDGHSLAVAHGRTLELVELAHPAEARVVARHPSEIMGISYAPDGRFIATAAGDKTVHVWRADGSGESVALAGHADVINSVTFSPDGGRIASASADGTLRIWRDLEPVGPADAQLWTSTNDCLSVEARQQLLGVDEAVARRLHARCLERVAAARR
jgi:WD40 repeat protein/serine/threonine protein kinase